MKCRCDACRKANTEYAKRRDHERAEQAKDQENPPKYKLVEKRLFGRPPQLFEMQVCSGVNGEPCPKDSPLRSDSKGNICGECRKRIAWNGLVPAERARAHMKTLSRLGMGMKSVAASCDVSETICFKIWVGTKKSIRADTERRILAVTIDGASDGNRIDARKTWRLIHALQKMGITKRELAEHLGLSEKSNYLYTERRRVTAKRAHQVKKFYELKVAELQEAERVEKKIRSGEVCLDCGLSHHIEDRKKMIARMLPCRSKDISEAYPCIYPYQRIREGHPEYSRTLIRDLREIGAVIVKGTWVLEGQIHRESRDKPLASEGAHVGPSSQLTPGDSGWPPSTVPSRRCSSPTLPTRSA